MRRAVAIALVVALVPADVAANQCRVLEVDLLPAEIADADPMRASSQIVVWLERADGAFVDTLFITAATGTYGLGNRPSRFDQDSGPGWPYGRRTTVFPIWAHRHGLEWPAVVFQYGNEDEILRPFSESSGEPYYCRPLQRHEAQWDTGTCASTIYTDKGKLDDALRTKYPPRADLVRSCYTFGPAVAGVVGESELLRATARGVLSPMIATVCAFRG